MFVEETSCQVRQGPKLQIQFASRNPGQARLPLEAIGNDRRVHGHWAQSGRPRRYPPLPPSTSVMKRATGIVPVPHSRLGPFAGRGSQCCASQRSLSYCDDDAQHSHVVETQETETPPGQAFHRRGQQRQPAARQALESRARRRPKRNLDTRTKRWGIRPTPYGRTADGAPVALS